MQYGGHLDTVVALLEAGANVRATDSEGHNALHFAASCRKELCAPRVDVMNALLAHDGSKSKFVHHGQPDENGAADEDQEGKASTRARAPDAGGAQSEATSQHVKVELVTAVDDMGRTPLHLAASR